MRRRKSDGAVEDETNDFTQGRGRSAKKRAAHAVEEFAAQLVGLRESEVTRLPLSDDLRREVDLARRTIGNSSRKRQIKYLAGLLRRYDEERVALETFIAGQHASQKGEREAFHRLEQLRDQLCAAETFESALVELERELPDLDLKKVSELAKTFHKHDDRKAFREIFQLLRKASEAGVVEDPEDDEDDDA